MTASARRAFSDDTIFALSSGAGRAALAVIRVSGPEAAAVVRTVAGLQPRARVAALRPLNDQSGRLIDRGLVLFFEAPASFTGEDVAEFQIHGGQAVVAGLLRTLGQLPGLRPARPGEFTRRALLNGKLDLTQAEAIADLIDSETEQQRLQALRQFDGALSERVGSWKDALTEALALIEADLDFSDEADVSGSANQAEAPLARVHADIKVQLGFHGAERIRDGVTVVVAGPPNAGKSTLLNWWAGRNAAIVTEIPGTTRDFVEVDIELDGIPVRLVDTAGLRETADPVERIGVERARQRAQSTDIVLWLDPDGSQPNVPTGSAVVIPLRSKSDSATTLSAGSGLRISVLTGRGMDELRANLSEHVRRLANPEGALLTRARHRVALESARPHLDQALATLRVGGPLEFVAEDIRLALRALDELLGFVGPEDVLDRLFASFCIGK